MKRSNTDMMKKENKIKIKKWWQTKRRRNEKGHYIKRERTAMREMWWNVKKASAKILHRLSSRIKG
jgi:hypothetical protein